MPSVARPKTRTLRNAACSFLFQRSPGGTTTADQRAFDKSLQMLKQEQEKDKQAWEQRSGVPVFSLVNVVDSRARSGGSNHCTSSDKIFCTAARDKEYVLGRDWNICSFAAQEVLQWNW
jgi:hypothetical protein